METAERSAAEALLLCVGMQQPRIQPFSSLGHSEHTQRATGAVSKNLAPLLHATAANYAPVPIYSSHSGQSNSSTSRSPPNYPHTPSEPTSYSSGASGQPKKRGRSAEGNSLDHDTVDEPDEDAEDSTKPLKNTKRAAQNRAAQRAFRERKEQYVRDLERKSTLLDETLADKRALSSQVSELQLELASMKTSSFHASTSAPPSYPLPSLSHSHRPFNNPDSFGVGSLSHLQQNNAVPKFAAEFERRASEWAEERADLVRSVEQERRRYITERETNKIERDSHQLTKGMLEESRRECQVGRAEFVTAFSAVQKA